jgi:hypothetical protein
MSRDSVVVDDGRGAPKRLVFAPREWEKKRGVQTGSFALDE